MSSTKEEEIEVDVDVDIHADHKKEHDDDVPLEEPTCLDRWAHGVHRIGSWVGRQLEVVVRNVIKRPKLVVFVTVVYAIFLAAVGVSTNFNFETDGDLMWTPQNAYTVRNGDWIDDESGFPTDGRPFQILVHEEGKNLLSTPENAIDVMSVVFDAYECIAGTPGSSARDDYDKLCSSRSRGCTVTGPTQFFINSRTQYVDEVQGDGTTLIDTISNLLYPNGARVLRNAVYGNSEPPVSTAANADNTLTSTLSMLVEVDLPNTDEDDTVEDYESDALDRCLDLRDSLTTNIFIEVRSERSTADELQGATQKDIPLVILALVVMAGFTAVILGDPRDSVKSQGLLGVGAVVGILLSIFAGYGLSFILAVDFTSIGLILPFVLIGIGLDDTFILTGEFALTDPNLPIETRFSDMILKGGAAITVTTATNVLAFALGSATTIPAISWFCINACLAIFFGYVIQITYVVGLMFIDERRRMANKIDCCVCKVSSRVGTSEDREPSLNDGEEEESTAVKYIGIYTDFILRPKVKVAILAMFTTFFALGLVGLSQITEDFDPLDLLPSGSYVVEFTDSRSEYNSRNDDVGVYVYFRDVDPATADGQTAMNNFLDDIENLDQVPNPAPLYWLREFNVFADQEGYTLTEPPFSEQLDNFLAIDANALDYGDDIVRDAAGQVTASRTRVSFLGVGTDAQKGVEALDDQLDVTKDQPSNAGRDADGDWLLFTHSGAYYNWEFFAVVRPSLSSTVVLGFVAVTFVMLLSLPDPRMVLVVIGVVFIIDVELLGLIPAAGLAIDPLTFLALTMAIGLVVDYCVHIVHAYLEYEKPPGITRNEVVRGVMTEIGLSILTGAFSTFLGVCILGLSSSTTFQTIFVMMMGIVCLGAGHGFIFMPVVLSLIGPLENPMDHGKHDMEMVRKSVMVEVPEDLKLKEGEEDKEQ